MKKIGYPCQNRTLKVTTGHSIRLKSFTEDKLKEVLANNIADLRKMINYNIKNKINFLRISSGFVPFASHPICKFDWAEHFKNDFRAVGRVIRKSKMRISMHPDHFVLINSPDEGITQRSINELAYHSALLDAMQLDRSAKMQIHVGGVYGDKQAAMDRFIERYKELPDKIKKRLVIENDDHLFSVKDCLYINSKTGIPILFDNLHHDCLNNKEPMVEAMKAAFETWKPADGVPLVDYSTQQPASRKGKHTDSIDEEHFKEYLKLTKDLQFDIMLEIKDKEISGLRAIEIYEEMYGKLPEPKEIRELEKDDDDESVKADDEAMKEDKDNATDDEEESAEDEEYNTSVVDLKKNNTNVMDQKIIAG